MRRCLFLSVHYYPTADQSHLNATQERANHVCHVTIYGHIWALVSRVSNMPACRHRLLDKRCQKLDWSFPVAINSGAGWGVVTVTRIRARALTLQWSPMVRNSVLPAAG